MVSEIFYQKLIDISKVMEEKGNGISYILNESNSYTIGTRIYSEEIDKYLDKTVEIWEGNVANLKKSKKGKSKKSHEERPKRVAYIWKIPLTEAK
jgi:hypothetical protein